jgi:hypothetical protein
VSIEVSGFGKLVKNDQDASAIPPFASAEVIEKDSER